MLIEERSQINDASFQFNKLEQKKIKSSVSTRLKVRTENNKIEYITQ